IALEALLRKRPAVTEQAQTHLAVDNDRAATHRIALDASERVRHPILSARDARHATDRDDRGRENPHPNTSPVMVRNHASASAASQVLAWEFAAKADFGIAPAIAASPMTWMPACSFDSNVTGSIGHHPLRSVTPATSAMRPAFCGGMTLATFAWCRPKSVTSV